MLDFFIKDLHAASGETRIEVLSTIDSPYSVWIVAGIVLMAVLVALIAHRLFYE